MPDEQRQEVEDCLQAVLNAELFDDEDAVNILIGNLRRVGDVTWEPPGQWVVRLKREA